MLAQRSLNRIFLYQDFDYLAKFEPITVLLHRAKRLPKLRGVALLTIILLLVPTMPQSYGDEEMSLCNCVAFRLDDIQDYWLNNVQAEIIETFRKNNASLTVGIIGNYFGDDYKMVSLLKSRVSIVESHVGGAHLEIANHGWNHEDFTTFDKTEQSDLIAKTNQKIFDSIGVTPSVFIPPMNRLNNDTIQAIFENGIYHVSANITESPILINAIYTTGNQNVSSNAIVYHFPSMVLTGDLNSDDTEWYGVSHNKTLDDIEESIRSYGYAVVTLHPQEYSVRDGLNFQNIVDGSQMHELQIVLEELKKKEIRIVTIPQISEYMVIPEFTESLLYLTAVLPLTIILIYTKRISKNLLSVN